MIIDDYAYKNKLFKVNPNLKFSIGMLFLIISLISPYNILSVLIRLGMSFTIVGIAKIEVKDYIKNPKESGYRSLHLIIEVPIFLENEKKNMKVEVQLRTIAMDFWASLEHKLRYKKDIPQEEAELLAKELVECANISADLDNRMEQIRNRIAKNK